MANKIEKSTDSPELFDYEGDLGKEWYIQFRRINPITGKRKPFQLRFGINYLSTHKERYEYAKLAIQTVKDALKAGWDPFTEKIKEFLKRESQSQAVTEAPTEMGFVQALEFAYEKKAPSLGPETLAEYKCNLKFATDAALKLQYHLIPIQQIKRWHIKQLLEQIGKDRAEKEFSEGKMWEYTGNAYNRYRYRISALFGELEDQDIIEYNPCLKIKKRQEIKTNKFRHPMTLEVEVIKAHLKHNHYNLLVYLAYETLTGLRPKELLGLQIKDIDWFNGCIDLSGTRAKTKFTRKVPIPDVLLPYIKKQKLKQYDPNFYIFSKELQPGGERVDRKVVSEIWRVAVKVELGVNVTLYSFKGWGGERKRRAKISHEAVQHQSFGHQSPATTDIYLHGESERQMIEIKRNTPGF